MSGGEDAEFYARLAALNDRFAASLPDTLARLTAARAAFDTAAPAAPLVGELHGVLHTLAGSSATFGFDVLGRQARLLEQRLDALTAAQAVASSAWAAWLGQLDVFVAWALADPKAAYPDGGTAV